ncbi:MAG: transporter [Alphaproteobacteria bacterium]|nr:transporter [Alphaproteobacteria bacterium]
MMNYFLILFQICINTAAQLFLKSGAKALDFSQSVTNIFWSMLCNVNVWIGGAIFIVSFLLWLYLLNQFDLSFLYPFGSLSFVLAAIGGWLIFGECMNIYRACGIFLVFMGVIFIAKS